MTSFISGACTKVPACAFLGLCSFFLTYVAVGFSEVAQTASMFCSISFNKFGWFYCVSRGMFVHVSFLLF